MYLLSNIRVSSSDMMACWLDMLNWYEMGVEDGPDSCWVIYTQADVVNITQN